VSEDVATAADLEQQYLHVFPMSLAFMYTDLLPDLEAHHSGVDCLLQDKLSRCQTRKVAKYSELVEEIDFVVT
jgi:hypothetical protein